MLKIRKGDAVWITKGKDRGKKGKVLSILADGKHALIEGLNLVKKHKRQARQDQQGGIVSIEAPISVSNLMFFCKQCEKPVRVGIKVSDSKTRSRFCKSCNEVL